MDNEGWTFPNDLQEAVKFHGHVCPGLLIGYRAAKVAAAGLGVDVSPDEELVLIAENDSCSVDAFQSLVSTTFGKGNLVFLDHGKQVFTLGDRRTGMAVRVALRADAFAGQNLSREEKISFLLERDAADLFHVNPVQIVLPDSARIHASVQCARCSEPTMESRTVADAGRLYCLPCSRDLGLSGSPGEGI